MIEPARTKIGQTNQKDPKAVPSGGTTTYVYIRNPLFIGAPDPGAGTGQPVEWAGSAADRYVARTADEMAHEAGRDRDGA